MSEQIEITDNPEARRFEAHVDEALRATIAAGKQIRPSCSFVRARAASEEFAAYVQR